jgi:hypothetical protein
MVDFFFHAIEMRRKRNIGAECECIANSMVTFLKFLLAYSMKFVKIYFFSNFCKILHLTFFFLMTSNISYNGGKKIYCIIYFV